MIKVKIRTWESMEKEFGLCDDVSNRIHTPIMLFTQSMENDLPEDRIIEVYKKETNDDYLWDIPSRGCWTITDFMVEKSTMKNHTKKIFGFGIFVTVICVGIKLWK